VEERGQAPLAGRRFAAPCALARFALGAAFGRARRCAFRSRACERRRWWAAPAHVGRGDEPRGLTPREARCL